MTPGMPNTRENATSMLDADQHPVGLRERKRAATRRTIVRVTRQLALREGLDAVTVDRIAAGADISTRSFFNYFATKEAALIALRADLPAPLGVDELRALNGDLAEQVTDILLAVLSDSSDQDTDLRAEFFRTFPDLLGDRIAAWRQTVAIAEASVERLLELQGFTGDTAVTARILITMATTALRSEAQRSHGAGRDEDSSRTAIAASMRQTAALF